MEKRAFKRRKLRLKGVCSAPGVGSRDVEIRDFCPGGMLLSFPDVKASEKASLYAPAHGDIVGIRCIVPSFHDQQPIQFSGRIVRLDAEGAGLAFIDPDIDALHNLHKLAKQRFETPPLPRQSGNLVSAQSASPSNLHKRSLLETCRRLSQESGQALIAAFLERAPERLMKAAEIAQSISDKNAFYDASNILVRQADIFKRTFALNLDQALHQTPERMAAQSPQMTAGFSKSQLSLVEDNVFEEWLAYSDTVHKAEAACLEQLSDLTHRVGVLFHAPINKENNPFAPVTFGKSFQDSMRGVDIEPSTLHMMYAIYRDELIVQLGTLYGKLNDYLIKEGVLADLRHKYRVKRAADTTVLPSLQEESTSPPEVQHATGREIPADSTASPGRTLPVQQDWYRLAQNINALQKQVSGQQAIGHTGRTIEALPSQAMRANVNQPEPQYFTPQELIHALNSLAASTHSEYRVAQRPQEIRSQLLSALSTGKMGQEQKQLPGREEKILDMAGNLLESVLTDKLISNNVRPWLERLSIPIFKMALNDESIFTDKSHLARQVINAVAQLEFYSSEDGDQGHKAVTQRIDGLLAEVESTDPVTLKVFGRVLRELSVLINVQNKAYEENFKEVLTVSAEEDQQARTLGEPTQPTGIFQNDDESIRDWKKRVRRLKLGDSLLVDAESKPRRLKLAWISENRNRFVFVNVKGLKELVISKDELALGMRNGSLIVLDDGGDSLLDRAQYSMLQKMHSHLLHETTHDQLTGLINRREFERRLGVALASARQHNLHHVICYIDLTQFNVVNNTFGYDGGDRLLAEIAELFDSQLGDRGVLARIGGDEFGMLLEDCSNIEALAITAQYKEAMQNYRFTVEDKSLAISFSAGLVALTKESDSVITLLQAAETCCRVARGKGSNYIQVFNAKDAGLSRHMEVLKWVTKIDEALDNESLDLRHQPIVGIRDDTLTVHHSEILLGVVDDEGQAISPADFVLAAEHFRRMAAVDRWVIQRAFHWMIEHADRLNDMGGLAINLSGSSLNEEGFIDFILDQAHKTQVPMSKVCFEITETAGIANLSNASEFILAVKKTGCMFALDDFGSGLSSYAYLKNLPVDFLKIDGMFIKNMDTNPYDFAVVKSITEIGHFMGKEIIAEYVENENILKMLREIGVDYAQGYAIAKPQRLTSI